MNNTLSRRSFVGMGAVAAAGLALAGCSSNSSSSSSSSSQASSSAETPTVRLGTTNDGHIFNAIANEQGYLAEEGVNVEVSVFSSSDDAFQALFSGKVDVLSNNGTNLPLTHIASGQDLTIYAGYMITGCMPIIAKTGTKWNGVEDLLGKTIACSGNEFAVFGPLYDAGHTMDEVTTIVLSNHADRVEAVRSGKADYAICGTSQNYNISQIDEVSVMCYCSDITPNYSCCRVASRQTFLNENSEGVTAMLRAWLRAQAWYEQHKDETAEIVVKQTGSTVEYVHAYMDNEHYRLNLDPYRASVERAWNWMSEMGLFPDTAKDIKIADHIDTKLYKAALDSCTEKYKSDDPDFYTKMNNIFAENDA
jgi:NitT/TauT family transport system substrate-binding protein